MASSDQIRRDLAALATKRAGLDKQISDAQRKKAAKEREAADRNASAMRTKSDSSRKSYYRQAESATKAAIDLGKTIADLSKKVADVSKTESQKSSELQTAMRREADAAARQAKTERDRAQRQQRDDERRRATERAADQRAAQRLVRDSESRLRDQIGAVIRPPAQENLRILYATASSQGDLRVDEEIRRVKAAVKAATHRDQVEIEHLPAATAGDLLDGLTSFRPHIVHFSGHANETVLVFDDGSDSHGPGNAITARSFKAAVEAPDQPPTLIVLNACESAAQLADLLGVVQLAVGMTDSIGDVDAITFATRFYRSLAEGQSVAASLDTAKAKMAMNGLPDADLPVLEHVEDLDPADVFLVIPPR